MPEGHCGDGFTEFQGYCYKMFSSHFHAGEDKDWWKAKDSCKEIGAELASIHSAREAAKLTTMLVDLHVDGDNTATKLWIGDHENGYDGIWGWSDETRYNYENWAPGEPNDMDYYTVI